jgi:hypothetical protein
MIDEGAPPEMMSSVLRKLQPRGRNLTYAQEVANKIEKLERRLGYSSTSPKMRERILAQIEDLRAQAQGVGSEFKDSYLRELDIINANKQLNEMLRKSNKNFIKGPNEDRILRGVKKQFMQDMEEELLKQGGGKSLAKLREADKLAVDVYSFKNKLPEIGMLLDKGNPVPEVTMNYLLKDPLKVKVLADSMDNPAAKRELADQLISNIARPI